MTDGDGKLETREDRELLERARTEFYDLPSHDEQAAYAWATTYVSSLLAEVNQSRANLGRYEIQHNFLMSEAQKSYDAVCRDLRDARVALEQAQRERDEARGNLERLAQRQSGSVGDTSPTPRAEPMVSDNDLGK